MSPFVFTTIWLKSLVPPIIAVAAATLGNVALSNEDLAVLFPWSSPYLIATGEIDKYSYSSEIALFIIIAVFAKGVIASFEYFIL